MIANRGEIAIRIARGGRARPAIVAVHSTDDAARCTSARPTRPSLQSRLRRARAYLDIDAIVGAWRAPPGLRAAPGYGFLAENPELARRCRRRIRFVGPGADDARAFRRQGGGERWRARGAPLIDGSDGAVTPPARASSPRCRRAPRCSSRRSAAAAGAACASCARRRIDVPFARCASRRAAFGNGALTSSACSRATCHVEVQVIGDAAGTIAHLGSASAACSGGTRS